MRNLIQSLNQALHLEQILSIVPHRKQKNERGDASQGRSSHLSITDDGNGIYIPNALLNQVNFGQRGFIGSEGSGGFQPFQGDMVQNQMYTQGQFLPLGPSAQGVMQFGG